MERPAWAPDGIDLDRPNAARMYDYALGGSHNFAVDRDMVEKVEAMMPGSSQCHSDNRDFLPRPARCSSDLGCNEFLYLSKGFQALGRVQEVARQFAPETRVVYVDNDPIAVAHGRALLRDL